MPSGYSFYFPLFVYLQAESV